MPDAYKTLVGISSTYQYILTCINDVALQSRSSAVRSRSDKVGSDAGGVNGYENEGVRDSEGPC